MLSILQSQSQRAPSVVAATPIIEGPRPRGSSRNYFKERTTNDEGKNIATFCSGTSFDAPLIGHEGENLAKSWLASRTTDFVLCSSQGTLFPAGQDTCRRSLWTPQPSAVVHRPPQTSTDVRGHLRQSDSWGRKVSRCAPSFKAWIRI